MDIAAYWKVTKTYSKRLTNVDKMSPGFFSKGAGITEPLEKYVLAWMKHNEADYMKFGRKAHDNVEKYMKTVLDKEIKDAQKKAKGKDGLSPDQLKSAKIIQSNLALIREELKEVLAGNKKPGNFERDAREDVNQTLFSAEDKKRMDKKMAVFAKVLKEATAFAKDYKTQLGKIDALLANAQKISKQVEASYDSKDVATNKDAVSNMAGISRMAIRIRDGVAKHYDTKVNKGSDWEQVRRDPHGLTKMPAAVQKRHNEGFDKCDTAGHAVRKIHNEVLHRTTQIEELFAAAESLSIAAPDPKEALKKIAEMTKESEKAGEGLRIGVRVLAGRVGRVKDMITRPLPLDRRVEVYDASKIKNIEEIKKCDDHAKAIARIEKWLSGPMARINDQAVLKPADELAGKVQAVKSLLADFKKVRTAMLKVLKECDDALAKERMSQAA